MSAHLADTRSTAPSRPQVLPHEPGPRREVCAAADPCVLCSAEGQAWGLVPPPSPRLLGASDQGPGWKQELC